MAATVKRVLPELELNKVSLKADLRNKVSRSAELTAEQAEILAAQVFDEALIMAGIGTELAAQHIGVNKSLVSRWRSEHYRERPSYAQLLQLPADFHLAMNRIVSRRFGFGRAALVALMDAAGDLAVATWDGEKVG